MIRTNEGDSFAFRGRDVSEDVERKDVCPRCWQRAAHALALVFPRLYPSARKRPLRPGEVAMVIDLPLTHGPLGEPFTPRQYSVHGEDDPPLTHGPLGEPFTPRQYSVHGEDDVLRELKLIARKSKRRRDEGVEKDDEPEPPPKGRRGDPFPELP